MSGTSQVLQKLALLRPGIYPARTHLYKEVRGLRKRSDLAELLYPFRGELTALDWETRGSNATLPDTYVVSVGLASASACLYIDFRDCYEGCWEDFLKEMGDIPLIAHNLFFEMSWAKREGVSLNWQACTYATLRYLMNEGDPGQKYGLKDAQINLLGWEETNEAGIDTWLIEHGFEKSSSKEEKEGYTWMEDRQRWVKPDKGEMWRCPPEVLGPYCVRDADATWLLWEHVLSPVLSHFDVARWFVGPEQFVRKCELLVEQFLGGVLINLGKLNTYEEICKELVTHFESQFWKIPEVAEAVAEWNQRVVDEKIAAEPTKFLKQKLGGEPPQFTKAGALSKTWEKWKAKSEEPPRVSKNWLKWEAQVEEMRNAQHFNPNSAQQLRWLIYEKLGYPVKVTTDTGEPSTDDSAQLGWGKVGKVISKRATFTKALTSGESLRRVLKGDHYHPQFRVPGTHTGRLSGSGGFNYQNPSKTPFMEVFEARPGCSLITCDFSSLEAVVLAELSLDPVLWDFYGPKGVKGDCIYLYNGSQIKGMKEAINAAGYYKETRTTEAVKKAKKEAKAARQIAKGFTLAANYGAGANKIFSTFSLQGVKITLEECQEMHRGYWQLYAGVKAWEKALLREWEKNGGWILNGIGRPVCVSGDYLKDISNRCVQSTGHDLLDIYNLIVSEELNRRGLPWNPWHIDIHDCMVVECLDEDVEEVKDVMLNVAFARLNEMMEPKIPLRGDANVCKNLWDDKREEDWFLSNWLEREKKDD